MCDLYDLEPCTVWRQTPRKARKQRECDSCGALIRPGDAYLSHFDVFEGEANTEGVCFACWWAWTEFQEHHGGARSPAQLSEMLEECYGEEGRDFWDEDDRHWRSLHAGLLRRYRASPGWQRKLSRRPTPLDPHGLPDTEKP